MLGETLAATSTTRLAYNTGQNQLRLVGFIDSSKSIDNWPKPRLGGWTPLTPRHISYAIHLTPRLGGWIQHGSQQ
jgi:hypothetical protein